MEYLNYTNILQYCQLYRKNPYIDEYVKYSENSAWGTIEKQWKIGNLLHNRNGPAFIYINNNNNNSYRKEEWCINGVHPTNIPSIISYYDNGQVVCEKWLYKDILHRIDGPAFTYYSRDTPKSLIEWYKDGELHRFPGPAYTYNWDNGIHTNWVWYYNGKQVFAITTMDIDTLLPVVLIAGVMAFVLRR